MIKKDTVFILGAGASCHYGYPTGESLIEDIVGMAGKLSDYCRRRIELVQCVQMLPDYVAAKCDFKSGVNGAVAAWTSVIEECEELVKRIETVRPLVIDYFLAWNEKLSPIGKLMIAAVILDCETKSLLKEHSGNDWYRFLVHKIASNCNSSADILKNNVHFVTFNYDVSLEHHLLRSLSSIDLFKATDIDSFLNDRRISHVYGSICHDIVGIEALIDSNSSADDLGARIPDMSYDRECKRRDGFLNRCFTASQSLRTIDPHEKEMNDSELKLAISWIDSAEVVYILGYGFDDNNNRRIGLNISLHLNEVSKKVVMFTNFEDRNTINKKASRLFFGHKDKFMGEPLYGLPAVSYAEKSVRNVYKALEMDFEPLEEN